MAPRKKKASPRSKRASQLAAPVASSATPSPSEASLLFWVQRTIDTATTRSSEVQQGAVAAIAGRSHVADESPASASVQATTPSGYGDKQKIGKRSRSRSTGPAHHDSTQVHHTATSQGKDESAEAVYASQQEQQQQHPHDHHTTPLAASAATEGQEVGPSAETVPSQPAQWQATPTTHSSIVVRDVMPFFEHLLDGQLGPVAVDVQLLGQFSLCRDAEAFLRTVESYESSSTGPLQVLLASVTPFFFTRGGGFYTMDTTVYPVLPALASLLMSSRVQKIVLNAPALYRLLFLFLGTDRVDIAQVVDIGGWGTVLRQSCSASRAQRQQLLPAATSDTLHTTTQLLAALPTDTRILVEAQAARVEAAPHVVDTAYLSTLGDDSDDSDDGPGEGDVGLTKGGPQQEHNEDGLTPPRMPATAPDLPPGGGPSALQLTDDGDNADAILAQAIESMNDSETALGSARSKTTRRARKHAISPHQRPTRESSELSTAFVNVSTVFHYYETLMRPLEDASIIPAPASDRVDNSNIAAGKLRPVVDVCARRGYAAFLCAAMTYHGILVDHEAYQRMVDHVTEQIEELCAAGNAVVDRLTEQLKKKEAATQQQGSTHSSTADSTTVVTMPSFSLTATTTAASLCAYLSEVAKSVPTLASSIALHSTPTARHGGSGRTVVTKASIAAILESSTQQVENGNVGEVEEQNICDGVARICLAWLAIQERSEYRTSTLGKLFTGLGSHLRVGLVPKMQQAGTSSDDGSVAADMMPDIAYVLHPSWSVHGHSTGRVFSSLPNVQTIPKDPPRVKFDLAAVTGVPVPDHSVERADPVTATTAIANKTHLLFDDHPAWTLRHLYMAPAGCTLVSLDFNQIELRVLAHLSDDANLLASFQRDDADVLSEVARVVFRVPPGTDVSASQRQAVKVIVYGLIYGMGPELLEERLQAAFAPSAVPEKQQEQPPLDQRPPSARELMSAIFSAYPAVQGYLRQSRLRAFHEKETLTLSGMKDLSDESDPNRRKQRAVAWAVQGGAADILHAAMCAVHQQRHSFLPFFPAAPLALLMTVHDELVYAVPDAAVPTVVPKIKAIVEEQGSPFQLRVPLRVSVKIGRTLGELTPYA